MSDMRCETTFLLYLFILREWNKVHYLHGRTFQLTYFQLTTAIVLTVTYYTYLRRMVSYAYTKLVLYYTIRVISGG